MPASTAALRLARGPPSLGKQLGDVFHRVSLNPEQDIGQVLVGVHPGEEAAGDDGVEDGYALTGLRVAIELPVFPAESGRASLAERIGFSDPRRFRAARACPRKGYAPGMADDTDSPCPDADTRLLRYLRDLGTLTLAANREWGRTMEPDGDAFLVRETDTMALGAETERYTLTEAQALDELLSHVKAKAAVDFPVPAVVETYADVVDYLERTEAFSWLREHLRQRAFAAQVRAARTKPTT